MADRHPPRRLVMRTLRITAVPFGEELLKPIGYIPASGTPSYVRKP